MSGGIETVGVCGSGIMGAGLAEVIARADKQAIVLSRSQQSLDQMMKLIQGGLTKQVTKEKISESEKNDILTRISGTTTIEDLHECDLVIESVLEDLETKRDLFGRLDKAVKPGAIIATNTSTLSVLQLALATTRPESVCGIHFFNPATLMTLVEVIRAEATSGETITRATQFVRDCGKDPVQVLDRVGFIVNALLFPYLNNAIKMHEAGTASKEDIDTAMKGGCNFPMGPFSLLDLVGLDTSLAILNALYDEFKDPNYCPAVSLKQLVAEGKLGRKTKQGFFTY